MKLVNLTEKTENTMKEHITTNKCNTIIEKEQESFGYKNHHFSIASYFLVRPWKKYTRPASVAMNHLYYRPSVARIARIARAMWTIVEFYAHVHMFCKHAIYLHLLIGMGHRII